MIKSIANLAPHSRQAFSGMLLALLAAVFFSAKAVFVKLAYAYGTDAVTLLTLRMAFALPVFALVAAVELRRPARVAISGKQGMAMIALGLLGAYLAGLLDFLGLQYVSASIERLVLFLYPTLTLLLSLLLLGRCITLPEIMAVAVSYTGIALSLQQEGVLHGTQLLFGALLVFGSALAYALYLIGSGELIARLGSRLFMAVSMVVSCLAMVVQFVLTRDFATLAQPLPVYGYGLLIAVFSTVLPAFMLAAAIQRIGAAHVSIIGGIGPVATIALAAVFLDEALSAMQVFGAALVITGVLCLVFFRQMAGAKPSA